MTDDARPDTLTALATAAAAVVATGQGVEEIRDLAYRINSDERIAIRAGRALAGALLEWTSAHR